MRRILLFIIFSSVLISCHQNEKRKTVNTRTAENSDSYLTEGEHYIEIDSVNLWYLVRGEGPVLIVYPSSAGWGGDCSIYVEYLKPLEKHRTVIYLEPRGLGKSERMDSISDYSSINYLTELENFRKKLAIDKFDLFGHCYAGALVMKYAMEHQNHLNSLILLSTFPRAGYKIDMGEWAKNRDRFEDYFNRNKEIKNEGLSRTERFKEATKNEYQIYLNNYNEHKEKIDSILDKTIFSLIPQKQAYREAPNYNIIESLKNVRTRTLIIYGDEDFPNAIMGSEEIHENMPNSKLLEIKNCCHFAFIEQPEIFFNATVDFLNSGVDDFK